MKTWVLILIFCWLPLFFLLLLLNSIFGFCSEQDLKTILKYVLLATVFVPFIIAIIIGFSESGDMGPPGSGDF